MNSNRTQHVATFRFSDSDISEIDRLKAEGFQFATVTMRDKRGYERAFKIWMPPQSDAVPNVGNKGTTSEQAGTNLPADGGAEHG